MGKNNILEKNKCFIDEFGLNKLRLYKSKLQIYLEIVLNFTNDMILFYSFILFFAFFMPLNVHFLDHLLLRCEIKIKIH
ncbi:MAG TPA: hypothetical protein DDZ69_05390 [Porphyromonadaceae bacterium]|nr:hypothetical protein [Porphyromonadaceae bacterium]